MCDVHLDELERLSVRMTGLCCYCGEALSDVEDSTLIRGSLDDGTPGVFEFVYHAECVFWMEFDTDEIDANEGCFSYGTPIGERIC